VSALLFSTSNIEQVLVIMKEKEWHFVKCKVGQYEQVKLSLVGAKWSQQNTWKSLWKK